MKEPEKRAERRVAAHKNAPVEAGFNKASDDSTETEAIRSCDMHAARPLSLREHISFIEKTFIEPYFVKRYPHVS